MQMKVSVETCTRHFSKVHPKIEALRAHRLSEHLDAPSGKAMHLKELFIGQTLILCGMSIRSNHKMPWIIRKGIENYEARFSSEENQTSLVVLLLREITKNTPILIL